MAAIFGSGVDVGAGGHIFGGGGIGGGFNGFGGEGLAFEQGQWDASGDQITMLMKGYMARDLWDMTRFFEVYNTSNEVFNKAVEILNDPSMVDKKLAKAERE